MKNESLILVCHIPDFTGLRLNDADSDPLPLPTVGHPMAIGVPMASAGSGGSGSGQNMIMNPGWVGPPHPLRNEPSPHQWEAPWMGPVSGSGSASTTTYGAIYNPAAPPPSANYTAMASNYSGYGSGRESAYGGQMHPVGLHQSSGQLSEFIHVSNSAYFSKRKIRPISK